MKLDILIQYVATSFSSFKTLWSIYSCSKTTNSGSFSWSEFISSWIQVICVVAQENGRPWIERGQKMFMNLQSAQIAMVCYCSSFPSAVIWKYAISASPYGILVLWLVSFRCIFIENQQISLGCISIQNAASILQANLCLSIFPQSFQKFPCHEY